MTSPYGAITRIWSLPDETPVIVSGGYDCTVRVWRLADGTPLVPPLNLPESVRGVAVDRNIIVTAAGADISPIGWMELGNGRLSGTPARSA